MTSSDIYYRLGQIEGDIHTLQTDVKDLKAGQVRLEGEIAGLRKENKEDLRNLRTELKGDMTEFRAESKKEHRAMRSEFKADIVEVKGEITSLKRTVDKLSTQVQQIATNQTKTDSKIDAFLWVNGVIFAVLTLFIAWKTLKETRKTNSEQKSEVSPLFSLDAIKSLIDYYKNS